ncbi:MAG: hypothetical protein ACFFBP_00490 [Promethearchaeota archaeon]
MQVSIDQLAEEIFNQNVKNIELISYFKRSTEKSPVFLSVINRNYAEIRPLLSNNLIIALEPVKSYIFNIDALENCFYESYQEKIDFLKDEIWKRKRAKTKLINMTEEMEPEEGDQEYELKLKSCLEFARKSIDSLDKMELEKEDFNKMVANYQAKMKEDPIYKFLLYVRNDKDFMFNKRTEDNEGVIRKKIISYSEASMPGNAKQFFTILKKRGFYKEYAPAQNYYITELGLLIDNKLKKRNWELDDEDFEKFEEEIAQEEEFNCLKDNFGF